jgi:hypothetical protein
MIPQWRIQAILRGRLAALGGSVECATLNETRNCPDTVVGWEMQ